MEERTHQEVTLSFTHSFIQQLLFGYGENTHTVLSRFLGKENHSTVQVSVWLCVLQVTEPQPKQMIHEGDFTGIGIYYYYFFK